MLVIRLTRIGKKSKAYFKIIVQEKRKSPSSTAIEFIGHYNPHTNPSEFIVKEDRLKYWLSKGAQPSPTVHNFLVEKKIIQAKKVVTGRQKKKKEKQQSVPAGKK